MSGLSKITRQVGALAALTLIAGCLGSSNSEVTRSEPATIALSPSMEDGSQSPLIADLLNRRSVLSQGPYDTISRSVMAANSRAAEAELRAARLRETAASKNWLPVIGPQVSLTSLGALVTSLVVEQVLFDNGRKIAEREFAKADVEVAAVDLAQNSNERVLSALDLYLTAQTHLARAAVNRNALERMTHFNYVMSERVKGGVSDRADLSVVTQRLSQMQNDLASDTEAAATAMAQLGAMSVEPLAGISGLGQVLSPAGTTVPLAILKSEAEAARSVAEAKAARAGYLPRLTGSGEFGSAGNATGVSVGATNGIGLGTGAALQAIEAEQAAATARVAQVREDVDRTLRGLEGQLASLRRQQTQAQSLAQQAADNYDIFAQQLQAGTRAVPEVVSIFETKIRAEIQAVVIAYDIARIELRMAAIYGTLVDGERI